MNTLTSHPGTLLVPSLLCVLAAPATSAPGQGFASAPDSVRNAAYATIDQVLFDEPGDGALWTRGRSFKAAFDGRGATVIPFFGSDAPRNYPLELTVSSVTIDGAPLPFSTDGTAVRDDQRVSIPHATFTEQYDIELDKLEQRFVFESLPRRGDLVLRMNASSELVGSDLGASLRFENELGRVDYSEAFAVDATGRKIALDSTLVDGTIQLTVPASFVQSAILPLTIDPFVTFFTVSGTSTWEKEPDVSYDVSSDRWCVSWSNIYSATDYDAYVRLIAGNGFAMSVLTIDFTGETWTDPHIANNNSNNVFLVVASVVPASGVSSIRGRLVTPATSIVGSVIQITPLDGWYRNGSDVGGDTFAGTSHFCVVFQRPINANNVDIEMQMVRADGTLLGGLVAIDNSIELDEWPSISNSTECQTGDNPVWTIVWQRRYTTSTHAIFGSQRSWSGGLVHPTFVIQAGSITWDYTLPDVSTILDSQFTTGERPYLVTYEGNFGDKDILSVAMRGNTIIGTRNLTGDFQPAWYSDQLRPSVDSDGSHFFVGWTETIGAPGSDVNVWVSDYYLSGTTIVPCEVHGNFAGSPQAEGTLVVSSKASGGGPRGSYFGTWQFASASNLDDIQGGLWNGCAPGGVSIPYCTGDGSGLACPCGNVGAAGNGCASSANPAGARISGSGMSSVALDTFQLVGQGMPPSSPCLYFQGTTPILAGIVLGDGLLCLTGTITRLGVVFNNPSGASTFPSSGMLSALGGPPAGGGTRYYQIWYRDSAPFCTGSTFNLTNGIQVPWSM